MVIAVRLIRFAGDAFKGEFAFFNLGVDVGSQDFKCRQPTLMFAAKVIEE